MLLMIILNPFLGFLSGILFGRYLGKGVCYITTILTFLSFLFSLCLFKEILSAKKIFILKLFPWLYSDFIKTSWTFYFDNLTVIMLIVVTFISTLVHLYSTEYMENDPHLPRFMSYLSLFTFFMLILVTGGNYVQMFVGWEGVGLSSYLLINFWFTRIQANKAAIKAMLVNRVGDFFILLAMFIIYSTCNTLDYSIVFSLSNYLINKEILFLSYRINLIDVVCLLLFFGAMGKSAQLGLHTWLPDAMEGPTPVSALIHAATMVTAGVFLVVRSSYLFECSELARTVVTFVGCMTAIFAATTGLFQNDMKKVIAYSTCSQLGYMIFACGLSSYEIAMFHLSNHAFFKALLFLGAGSVIHAMSDEQDMRRMGGLKNLLPFSYASGLIGSFALVGFPFLAGYFSKDAILEVAASSYSNIGQFSYYLGLLAAFCTAYYSTRLIVLVYLVNTNSNKQVIYHAHEPSWRMGLPLFILSIFSIFVGYFTKDFFIGLGNDFWGSSIFFSYNRYNIIEAEFLDTFYKILPFFITISGIIFAYLVYFIQISEYLKIKMNPIFNLYFLFFSKKWYFDRLYNQLIGQSSLYFGLHYCYKIVDRGIIEKLGPLGFYNIVYSVVYLMKKVKISDITASLQTIGILGFLNLVLLLYIIIL